jgi:hypothetical protein
MPGIPGADAQGTLYHLVVLGKKGRNIFTEDEAWRLFDYRKGKTAATAGAARPFGVSGAAENRLVTCE